MVAMSTLIGHVPSQELTEFYTSPEGEEFVKLNATFGDVEIPIVVSKYVWNTDLFGKIKISGYLDFTRSADGKYEKHIKVHNARSVDADTEESALITLNARITKLYDMTTTKNGVDVRKFVTAQSTSDKKTVIINVYAHNYLARALGSCNTGEYIVGVGQLRKFIDRYDVLLTEMPTIAKGGRN